MRGVGPFRALAIAAITAFLALFAVACQPVMPVDEGSISQPAPDAIVTDAQPTASIESDVTEDTVSQAESLSANQPSVEEGIAAYSAQYCGICHQLTAAETTGRFGPSHDSVGLRAESRIQDPRYSGEARTAEEYLYESIVKPQAYIVDGYAGTSHPMPPYAQLSEEQLRALVVLLMAQR